MRNSRSFHNALIPLFALCALGCSARTSKRTPSAPEPCTVERALRELKPDLRTVEELCPTRRGSTTDDPEIEPSPRPEESALARELLGKLCAVSEKDPASCATARREEYADLVENSAEAVFLGAFTNIEARQALLAVGPHSVLFERVERGFEPRAVLPWLQLDFASCFVVAPPSHTRQIACFQRSLPERLGRSPRTILDVHDFESMRTTRLFSFSDTFLTSCGNVDVSELVDLLPSKITAAQREVAPSTLTLQARYLIAQKPKTYDRDCLDLLQRNFEMGPPTGDTAALVCALPPSTDALLGFKFVSGAWQPIPATQDLLERLDVDGPWYRTIDVEVVAPPSH